MGFLVCAGATLQCSFGQAPAPLSVPPKNKVLATKPAANIMDHVPMANIPAFGMCQSIANPTVAAATAAALGALTPMPCVPATTAPWSPACPTCMVGGQPALNDSSQLLCSWGGIIQIKLPSQTKAMIK